MHTDPRTKRARKGRLAGALLAMSIAAGAGVVADADGASAATSNPTARCDTSSHFNYYTNSWYTTRAVYFEPNIEVAMRMEQGRNYQSERVEYTAWLVRWDGSRWVYHRDSQGAYKSITGEVYYQSTDFPRSVGVERAGWYRWYVEFDYYAIGASRPQHFEAWSNNYCYA